MTNYRNLDEIPVTMSVVDVGKALNISRANAYNLVNRQDFPKILVGKRKLIPKSQFIKWLNENTKCG